VVYSCQSKSGTRKVKNSATIVILNGRDKLDSVTYTCDSCEKYIAKPLIFDSLIHVVTQKTKTSLKNPLSFIPRSIKLTVSKRDSLYYYETNKLIDSCIMVEVEYKCIGQNAYGTEQEVEV